MSKTRLAFLLPMVVIWPIAYISLPYFAIWCLAFHAHCGAYR
jgi:hypothetical protein